MNEQLTSLNFFVEAYKNLIARIYTKKNNKLGQYLIKHNYLKKYKHCLKKIVSAVALVNVSFIKVNSLKTYN